MNGNDQISGDGTGAKETAWVTLKPEDLSVIERYKLLIGAVIPRPIAFVSSISAAGEVNLAPFSFYSGVATNPPTIMFSVGRKRDGSKKDTLRNIEETKELVVNMVSEQIAGPMVQCSAEFPGEVNEFKEAGLTELVSTAVKPPRVKESPLQLECILYKLIEIGKGGTGSSTVIIGEIKTMHIDERAFRDGDIEAQVLRPVSRLGGISYSSLGKTFKIPRPVLK